jgi:ribose transport system substrate-binding protein
MKNKKLVLVIIAALISTLAFAGCSEKASNAKPSEPLPNKACLLLPYAEADTSTPNGINEILKRLPDAFDAYAQKAGIAVTHMYADGDAAKQSEQITEAANSETGIIVIVPVSGANLSTGINAANTAGVPTISLHESIEGEDGLSAVIVPDYLNAVEALFEAATSDHPDTVSNSAMLFLNGGPEGDKTADALNGFDGISESGDSIIQKVFSDWTFQGGRDATAKFLEETKTLPVEGEKEPGAVIAANASMASGAARAISSAKMKKTVDLYALNPSGLNADLITSGKAKLVAVPDAAAEAKVAVDICKSLIDGKDTSLNHMISFLLIDKENLPAE